MRKSKILLETHSGLLSFEKYEAFILENVSSSRGFWCLPDQVLDKKGSFKRDLSLIKSEIHFLVFCKNYDIFFNMRPFLNPIRLFGM